MKNLVKQFLNGELSVNEFTVLVAVNSKADKTGAVKATTTEIADGLNNSLSRHAVARALRNLQDKNLLTWQTNTFDSRSTIYVR